MTPFVASTMSCQPKTMFWKFGSHYGICSKQFFRKRTVSNDHIAQQETLDKEKDSVRSCVNIVRVVYWGLPMGRSPNSKLGKTPSHTCEDIVPAFHQVYQCLSKEGHHECSFDQSSKAGSDR